MTSIFTPDFGVAVHVQRDALSARLPPRGRRRLWPHLLQGRERDGIHGGAVRLQHHTCRSVSQAASID